MHNILATCRNIRDLVFDSDAILVKQRTEVTRPQAVWDDCLNGIPSIFFVQNGQPKSLKNQNEEHVGKLIIPCEIEGLATCVGCEDRLLLVLDVNAPNHSYGRLPWQNDSTLHYRCKSNKDCHAKMPSPRSPIVLDVAHAIADQGCCHPFVDMLADQLAHWF